MASTTNTQTSILLSLTGVLLLMGTLASCEKSKSPQDLIVEAREYQQNGDNKAAIIQLKNALQKTPDNADARFLLGSIYNDAGDPLSAEKEIQKAINLGMNPATALPELVQALLAQGQYQTVIDETNLNPELTKDSQILALRGYAYLALERHDEARKSFLDALEIKKSYPDALIGLAKHSLAKRDMDSATLFSEQATSQNPENVDAWLFKGDLLRIQGKPELALAAYNQALNISPDNATAYIAKANLEIGTKNFEAAKADIDAARKVMPKSLIVFYTQALLDFSQEKHAAALESLQQVLRAAPEHMPSILLAGAVQYALGSMPQAEQHFKKYLEKNPQNNYARKMLASTLLNSRQPQYAIDVLSPALVGVQQDAQLFALAGNIYTQTGDYTKASEYFTKASKLAPQSAELHSALGLSKLALGQNDSAVAEMETAVKLDTQSPKSGVMLALTHLRLKEYDKALAAAKVVINGQPDDPLGYNLKGAAFLGKNATAEARESFEKAVSLQPTYFPAVANLVRLDQQENKPDAAKKRLESLFEKDNKNIQVMVALAGLALSQGKTSEVTDWLERANKENPDLLQPAAMLSGHYLKTGEKSKALSLAKKLQAAHPENPDALDILAQAQFSNGDKPAALDTYNKIVALKPDSALAQFRIATIHIAMKNQAAASAALKKSLALQPDFLDAQLAQAMLEINQSNFEGALSIARKIQKQNGSSPVGYALEGDILMAQKKSTMAVKAFERALSIGDNGPLMIKLHSSLNQAGKNKEAAIRLTQWLKAHPADVSTRMYFAGTLLEQKSNKDAIEQLQTVLQQEPDNAAALNDLAWAYQQEKDPRALEYAEKANQIVPDNASVIDTLGWILLEQGNTSRGLPLLQKANSLSPDIAEIHYHLIVGLVKSGDKNKAKKELEQLLATGKHFAQIEDARALLKQL